MKNRDNKKIREESNLVGDAHFAMKTGEARRLRRINGLSLRQAARDLGVTPATVFQWETGGKYPRHQNAIRYARLLRELRQGALP